MKRKLVCLLILISLLVGLHTSAVAQPENFINEDSTEEFDIEIYNGHCLKEDCSEHLYSIENTRKSESKYEDSAELINPQDKIAIQRSRCYIEEDFDRLANQFYPHYLNLIDPNDLLEEVTDEELIVAVSLLDRTLDDISRFGIVYDAVNRPLFLLVEFKFGGFVLVLRTLQIPWEYSRTSEGSPYSNHFENKLLYLGLLAHAAIKDNEVLLLHTGEQVSEDDLILSAISINNTVHRATEQILNTNDFEDELTVDENQPLRITNNNVIYYEASNQHLEQNEFTISTMPSVANNSTSSMSINSSYIRSMPFGYNDNGDCGYVAGAQVLRYFQYFRGLDIPSTASHIDPLKNTIKSHKIVSGNGTIPHNVADAINIYLGTISTTRTIRHHARWGLLGLPGINQLNIGNPIVLLGTSSITGMHAMLCYGYENNYLSETISYKVHTGWHGSSSSIAGCVNYVNNNLCNGGFRDEYFISSFLVAGSVWLEELPSSHTHNYPSNASFIIGSYDYYKCQSCNLIQRRTHTHNYVIDFNQPASCTSKGVVLRRCTTCQYSFSSETPELGHLWNSWTTTTAATCTAKGSQRRACTRNSIHIETQDIPILNHSWGAWTTVTIATCTATGSERRTCSQNTSHTESRNTSINSTNHNWGAWSTVTAATCSSTGSRRRTCTRNSTHQETQSISIDPANHNWGAWMLTTAANCVATGSERRACTRNTTHAETRSTPINSTNHNWGAWTTTTAATCTAAGSQRRSCTRFASHTQSQSIPSIGHSFPSNFNHTASQHWRVCGRSGCSVENARGSHVWLSNATRCAVCNRLR